MQQETITETELPTFQFIVTGQILSIDGVKQVVLQDGMKFRLAKSCAHFPEGYYTLEVLPSTDSSGKIATVAIESYWQAEPSTVADKERCFLVGRVLQLGKKNKFVQVKVERPGSRDLKLYLLSPDRPMKIGQLWQVVAIRQGESLYVEQATLAEEDIPDRAAAAQQHRAVPEKSEASAPQKDAADVKNGAKVPPAAEVKETNEKRRVLQQAESQALAALEANTGLENWNLNEGRQRKKSWEWEAVHPATKSKARVQIVRAGKEAKVYCYESPTSIGDSDEPDEEMPSEVDASRLSVTPLGAARGIGASCFRVLIGPYEIVLDCGTRPKGYDPLPALEHLENPDLLIITHSHQDHLGAVPVFHSRFPGTRMICTPGTREIAHVMLTDCLRVQQQNEDSPELFDEVDLERTLFRLETEPVGIDFEPLPGLKVRFINAGHILGAACVYLRYGERSLFYTGDYNTTSSRTTTGLKLADLPAADILITESTYGSDTHPGRKAQETALVEAISEVVSRGGNVLIPAFALGRAQEIILAIRTNKIFHNSNIPVYVDGLVRSVTDVFRDSLDLLPTGVQNLQRQNGVEPFCDPEGNPPIIPIAHPKERPLAIAKPSVIIASSGMLTGGPSVYYAGVLLERDNAAIFISGYTDEESPGRLLQNLQTGDEIELDGKQLTVKAEIRRFNLSAHADKIGLTQVINRVNPKHLVLIHGCGNALHDLADSGDLKSKYYIHIPSVGDTIEYGDVPGQIGELQIAAIELPQEFEVNIEAEYGGAWLQIPEEVVNSDPRWHLFANSGIIKAKWDGHYLKLMPISQQKMAQTQAQERAIASGEDCCAVCDFYKSGYCQNEESPLSHLKVDPAGDCPEFSRGTESLMAESGP
ncbi:MAG: MBL fold metallo-hydrolase [Hormoscilla sp.]